MELRRAKLIQELREAREELLNINFATDISSNYYRAPGINRPVSLGYVKVSNRYGLVNDWFNKWTPTFERFMAFTDADIETSIRSKITGYERETDAEIFNELRPVVVSFIDFGLRKLDQEYQVKSLLEDYTKRVKDTKLAVLLNEFNATKDIAPNLVAIGFRTILSLVIQEKAKREKPGSNTATRPDLAVDRMIDSARTDGILSGDDQRLLDSFKSTHKDIYDFVGHRPKVLVDKNEVDTMVDLLNKLLPSIIN